jgi:hypothetical protein
MDDTDKKRKDWANYALNEEDEKASLKDSPGSIRISEGAPMHKGTPAGLWAGFILLAVALAVVAKYGYSMWGQHSSQLAQLPGLVNSLARVGTRVDNAEAKLQAWMAERDDLVRRVAVLDRKVSSTLRLARKQTQELVAQVQSQMQHELDTRAQAIEARLTRFESDQDAERVQLAQLQEEVANARQEIATVRTDTDRELASLRQQQAQSQGKLETIATQLDRQRIDFEVAKNEVRELTPEISLRVTRTNASYQRYEGWMWYEPDRRTLWIADQGVQQPVALRPKQGGEPYELVVTRVDKNGATGYLLVPAGGTSDTKASFAAQDGQLAVRQ